MSTSNGIFKLGAARSVAALFGVLAGLGGLVHGIGEVVQGNVRPDGLFVPSWTSGPIATNMDGEPTMTIVPNLLAMGILTTVTSLTILMWASLYLRRKQDGRVLVLLSFILLLVGGGVGPPVIGILAGVAGIQSNASLARRRYLPDSLRPVLAHLWPWAFGVAATAGTFLVVGSLILVVLFDLNNADLFLNTFFVTILSLLLTVVTTPAYEHARREQAVLAKGVVG
ncbi:MAG: hypothetical protein KDD84_21330 [Caldilineaceae bacterium]|nr:hypothetical protein [Caldilineaceae bacterium]